MNNKYTIDFNDICEDDGYIEVKINETIEKTVDSLGSEMGIDKNSNTLWFTSYVNPDNKDVKEFIKDNFKKYQAVLGFIRMYNGY